jgi:uncharacterized protein with GYD domain
MNVIGTPAAASTPSMTPRARPKAKGQSGLDFLAESTRRAFRVYAKTSGQRGLAWRCGKSGLFGPSLDLNRRYATNYVCAIRSQEREELMAIYITQGRYTPDAVKGMVANPENREKAVADLMEKAGAKLLAHYFTFGEYDFLSIAEAPSEEVMASALIAGAASGGISHLRTSVAMTAKDAVKAFKSAGTLSKSFKPPGR